MNNFRRVFPLVGLVVALFPVASQAATYVVDRLDDGNVAGCSAADNDCTLRGAMTLANRGAGDDTLAFAPAVRGTITIEGAPLPVISGQFAVEGPGANLLKISGAGQLGLFDIAPTGGLTVSGLTLVRGNRASGSLIFDRGVLTANDCAFQDGFASGAGGAIFVNSASATLNRCTLNNNLSANGGGAISFVGAAPRDVLSLSNCTVTGNSARLTGGAIAANGGLVRIESSTIANNSSGFAGAVSADGSASSSRFSRIEVANSIIARNRMGDVTLNDADGSALGDFVSGGHNLVGFGNGAARFNATGDRVGVADARLGALANNGGPTQTLALLPDSPALNAGASDLTVDQRGAMRPQNGVADIGAFELRISGQSGPGFVVTRTGDNGDGYCDAEGDGDGCTLSEAVGAANAAPTDDEIRFAPGVSGTITLSKALPQIQRSGSLTVFGPEEGITIDANAKGRVFQMLQSTLTLNDLTLTGGAIVGGGSDSGAGISNNRGTLTVNRCTIRDNSAFEGGGISTAEGTTTVRDSTFSGNVANNGGGGALQNFRGSTTVSGCTFSDNIATFGGAASNDGGQLSFSNTTISGNRASGRASNFGGGALATLDDNGSANGGISLDSCTLVDNSAAAAAKSGIWVISGALTTRNSIIAGNGSDGGADGGSDSGAGDIFVEAGATFSSGGNNLIGNAGAETRLVDSDIVGVSDPQLGPLAANGGATFTRALLPDSRALDAGATDLTTDQRGQARPQGRATDIGAFESDLFVNRPPVLDGAILDLVQNLDVSRQLAGTDPDDDELSYAVRSGTLPDGLSLTEGGLLVGTPTQIETQIVIVRVKDGNGGVNDGRFVINIVAPNRAPDLANATLRAQQGAAFSAQLAGTDADGDALTYKIVGGALPAGLRLRARGLIFGTPTKAGTRVVTIRVRDGKGGEADAQITFDVAPKPAAPSAFNVSGNAVAGRNLELKLSGTDPLGTRLSYRITRGPRGLGATGVAAIGRRGEQWILVYRSSADFSGADNVKFIAIARDGRRSTPATARITVRKPATASSNAASAGASGGNS